jgi:hypothetical protein
MTDEPPHTRSFSDKMARYLGDIDNAVYKAEIACNSTPGQLRDCLNCAFNKRISEPICPVEELRRIIGDHVKQDNCMREALKANGFVPCSDTIVVSRTCPR